MWNTSCLQLLRNQGPRIVLRRLSARRKQRVLLGEPTVRRLHIVHHPQFSPGLKIRPKLLFNWPRPWNLMVHLLSILEIGRIPTQNENNFGWLPSLARLDWCA
jgi:hypothetical protein